MLYETNDEKGMMTHSKQMFFRLISVAILLCLYSLLQAAPTGLDDNGHLMVIGAKTDGFSCTRLENGVQLRVGESVKNVIFYGPSTVRVNENLGENYWEHPSIVVVGEPVPIAFEIQEAEGSFRLYLDGRRVLQDWSQGAKRYRSTHVTLSQGQEVSIRLEYF
jgi:alpha-D-xyloside xylohydrolase